MRKKQVQILTLPGSSCTTLSSGSPLLSGKLRASEPRDPDPTLTFLSQLLFEGDHKPQSLFACRLNAESILDLPL